MADTAVGGELATDRGRLMTGAGRADASTRSMVQRIAIRAAVEVPDVVGLARRRFSLPLPLPLAFRTSQRAQVRVDVGHDQVIRISLAVRVRYPAPARETAEAVRLRVAERVSAATGLTVGRVDVTVTELVNEDET
jgi:uncharacterized alkaline shock family protein YloU